MQLNFNPHTFSSQPPPATNPRPIPVTRTSPYVDTGCRYNPSCLDCPLPACVEDLTPQQVKVDAQRRALGPPSRPDGRAVPPARKLRGRDYPG